jgi:hypothetical protein
MNKWLIGSVLSVLVSGLVGCGSDDDTAAPPATTETGYLIGGLIEAVPYQCGPHEGRTGRLGDFTFDTGEPCDFSLGDLVVRASAAALEDQVVTPYDLTRSSTEAWTLMAILDALSYRRPDTDLFLIVDGVLIQRLPSVDLSQGDAAIAAALAPFKGTTNPVSVQSGRDRLGVFVDENQNLTRDLDDLLDEGEEILSSLGVGAPGVVGGIIGETNHNNVVNLRIYDYEANQLPVAIVSYQPGDSDDNWLWVTSGENPDNRLPVAGPDEGDITGRNVVGIDLDVGRSKSTQAANDYKNRAFSPGSFPAPITILAHGVTDDEQDNSHFGQELNFGYHINLMVVTGLGSFNCGNLMLGQGSTSTSFTTYLDLAKNLIETSLDGFEFVESGGEDVPKGESALKSFTDFVDDLFDIHYQNWWILGLNAQSESYRTTAWGDPAVLMQCSQNGATVAVLGWSTYDDHTYNLQVAFPGQPLVVQK